MKKLSITTVLITASLVCGETMQAETGISRLASRGKTFVNKLGGDRGLHRLNKVRQRPVDSAGTSGLQPGIMGHIKLIKRTGLTIIAAGIFACSMLGCDGKRDMLVDEPEPESHITDPNIMEYRIEPDGTLVIYHENAPFGYAYSGEHIVKNDYGINSTHYRVGAWVAFWRWFDYEVGVGEIAGAVEVGRVYGRHYYDPQLGKRVAEHGPVRGLGLNREYWHIQTIGRDGESRFASVDIHKIYDIFPASLREETPVEDNQPIRYGSHYAVGAWISFDWLSDGTRRVGRVYGRSENKKYWKVQVIERDGGSRFVDVDTQFIDHIFPVPSERLYIGEAKYRAVWNVRPIIPIQGNDAVGNDNIGAGANDGLVSIEDAKRAITNRHGISSFDYAEGIWVSFERDHGLEAGKVVDRVIATNDRGVTSETWFVQVMDGAGNTRRVKVSIDHIRKIVDEP